MFPEIDAPAAERPALIVPDSIRQAAAADQATVDRPAGDPAVDRPAAAPAVPIDYTAEGRDLVEFTIGTLAEAYPSLSLVYTADVRARMGARIGRVLQKYELTGAALWGRFEPEIMLSITIVPLIGPTVRAVRADRATAEATPDRPAAITIDRSIVPPAGRPIDQPAAPAPSLSAQFPGLDGPQVKEPASAGT